MGASHVVGLDYHPGNRVGASLVAQQKIVVGLVRIALAGGVFNGDHAVEHRAALFPEYSLVHQIAEGVVGDVVLVGFVVDMAVAVKQ